MMHRLTNTYPRLREEGPAWAGVPAGQPQTPAAGDGVGGQPQLPALLAPGAFITPSVEPERVCD